jgi:hypothetical protein
MSPLMGLVAVATVLLLALISLLLTVLVLVLVSQPPVTVLISLLTVLIFLSKDVSQLPVTILVSLLTFLIFLLSQLIILLVLVLSQLIILVLVSQMNVSMMTVLISLLTVLIFVLIILVLVSQSMMTVLILACQPIAMLTVLTILWSPLIVLVLVLLRLQIWTSPIHMTPRMMTMKAIVVEKQVVQFEIQNLMVIPNHPSSAITRASGLTYWLMPETITGGLFTLPAANPSLNAMSTTSRMHKTCYWRLLQSILQKRVKSMTVRLSLSCLKQAHWHNMTAVYNENSSGMTLYVSNYNLAPSMD